MMRRSDLAAVPSCLLLIAALSSCNHKDLCFDHPDHTPRYATDVKISYDLSWEQPYENRTDWNAVWPSLGLDVTYDDLRPVVPEGVRMMAYGSDGRHIENNLLPHGEEVYLTPGDNSLLFYNNDTEFIVFSDMGSYHTASATTRSRSRSTYKGNPHYVASRQSSSDEVTVAAPDVLSGHYIDSYVQNIVTKPQRLDIIMHPLVFTYVVRYKFAKGYEHVALARGALSGMAESVFLHDGHTSKSAVTILYDCDLKPWGIEARVRSFGVPDFPNPIYSRGDGNFALNLEVRLKNGKILNFYFDVTDQLRDQPHGGVITVGGIDIDDGEAGGGSGFDVTVDGWGEFKDVTIDF